MNYFKTALLLIILTALLIFIGHVVGGYNGAVTAFVISLLLNVATYWFSDKIVLGMYRAKELPAFDYPELRRMAAELASKARIPCPKLYMTSAIPVPNAFATGRNPKNAAICVTKSLLDTLDADEIRGVLAHEMSHIKNRDTLIMTVVAAIASAVMMLAYMARWAAIAGIGGRDNRDDRGGAIGLLAVSLLAPIAAMLIQLAISRSREYGADYRAAGLAGSGRPLASALRKLHGFSSRYRADVAPQSAHLFIVNPLKRDFIYSLFMTHPPVEKRIERLMKV